jgi:hypothetical protein
VRLAEVVLWGSLAAVLYAYGLYPLLVWILSRCTRSPANTPPEVASDALPSVTLLIRAGSDEHFIAQRLENALELDYPRDRLQILVGCAGEEDLTALLARSFDRRLIEVIQVAKRSDADVLNECLRQVRGDVVVLSDARTLMRSDALQRLAVHFHDAPDVGGVCGKLRVIGVSGRDALDGRFARLENFLRRSESRRERVPEVKSGILAIRSNLMAPIGKQQPVDVVALALDIVRKGYRLIYDDRAVATREASLPADANTPGRGRNASRRRHGLRIPSLDRRRGLIASAFWMHRVLRRLCPLILIAAFVGNACLLDDPFYLHFMLIHALFYVVALVALYFTTGRRRGWFGFVRATRGRSHQGFDATLADARATL